MLIFKGDHGSDGQDLPFLRPNCISLSNNKNKSLQCHWGERKLSALSFTFNRMSGSKADSDWFLTEVRKEKLN